MVEEERFEEILMVLRTNLGAITADEIADHVSHDKQTTEQYLKYLEHEGVVEKGEHNFSTVWKLKNDSDDNIQSE